MQTQLTFMIQNNLTMDIFGYKTQGINYDKFRPKYPSPFIQGSLAIIKSKNKYLDIATGTGILLYALASNFKFAKGIDISKTMIDTAQEKMPAYLVKNPQTKLQLEIRDVMEIGSQENYDLITVAQALHFFPIQKSLFKIKELLKQDGKFITFGYVPDSVQSKNEKQNDIFNNYYKKVKPLFTFDRNDLHTHYSNKEKYPFQKVFPKVTRELIQIPLQMNKLEYISYLKTMSGYNLYLEKHKDDPLIQLEKDCADQVSIILDYFKITCSLS